MELKSVNHRYLDLNIRMPRRLNAFEVAIRNLIREKIRRGKVDVNISYEDYSTQSVAVKYNEQLAGEYLRHLKQMSETFGLDFDIRTSTLSRYPDVFVMEEQASDPESLWQALKSVIEPAMYQLVEVREKEGMSLKKDLDEKLDHMLMNVALVEERAPKIVEEYRARIHEQVAELLGDVQIDENRLSTEIVLFSDKICTDEETVRLKSHIHAMKELLESDQENGRRLDFVAQEMNREANTILSKSNDRETSRIAIDLKTEIEKIREQIQNIE